MKESKGNFYSDTLRILMFNSSLIASSSLTDQMWWENSNLQENRIRIETIPTISFYNHKDPSWEVPISNIQK